MYFCLSDDCAPWNLVPALKYEDGDVVMAYTSQLAPAALHHLDHPFHLYQGEDHTRTSA